MLAAENNRLSSAPKPVAKRIKVHIRWLEKEFSHTEGDLEAAIESIPALGENEAHFMRSVPGVGPVLARTLRGHRSVWGGKAEVRALRCTWAPWWPRAATR
jgi:hypothetical protein